jgi:hypothetical protein
VGRRRAASRGGRCAERPAAARARGRVLSDRGATLPLARHLWSTDFDGTLYGGPRRTAAIPAEVIEAIAQWLGAGGSFQVLSAGSLRGLCRDMHPANRFDLVPHVGARLAARVGEAKATRSLRAGFTFAMSDGDERYGVVRPDRALADGQLRFEPAGSRWLARDEAAAVRSALEAQGLEELAADAPLADGIEGVCAMFLQLCAPRSAPEGAVQAERLNAVLARRGLGARVRFVREHEERGRRLQRFDAFAAPADGPFGKLRAACEIFPRFARVLYTADRADTEGDREVFRFAARHDGMEACEVQGPADVLRAVGKALAGL